MFNWGDKKRLDEENPAKHSVIAADPDKENKQQVFVDNDSIISDSTLVATQEGVTPVFLAKCNVINRALSDIGMGRYQYELFFAGGFGWFADNVWLQIVAIVQPAVSNQWVNPNGGNQTTEIRFTTLALYVGLILGATFWGCSADIIGRKTAWNSTLFIGGIFGVAAGAAPNFVALCALIACFGFGVGGNLPVDGTMYLEFLPGTHQWLLTLLSLWWAVGQLVASLVAWGFLARWGCETPANWPAEHCTNGNNMGWRYTYYTLGAMMVFLWVLRMFVLPVYESPKFLITMGKDQAAVDVVNKVAERNGSPVRISLEDMRRAAEPYLTEEERAKGLVPETKFSPLELVKNSFSELSLSHVKPLFANRRLAYSTSLIVFCYGAVGLAYPLYMSFLSSYLAAKNANIGTTSLDKTYAAYTYQAACGIPGSILAAVLVTVSRVGRKYAMAFCTVMTGVFLLIMTTAKNEASLNGFTCVVAFFANAFYGVIYGYAPELFPTPSRGTGDALCAAMNRICGLMAPIIAIYSNAAKTPDGPVFAAGGIFIATGIIMCFLPVETRGKTAL